MYLWHMREYKCIHADIIQQWILLKIGDIRRQFPGTSISGGRGGGGGGAWTSYQVWRQNLGQGPAKLAKQEIKLGKFCNRKTQKLGKNPNFGVKSEIQWAQFGAFVTYIFGGKIWAPTRISEANFGAKPPPTSQYESTPTG